MNVGNGLKRVKEMSENQSAGVGWLKFLAFVIILAVVVYSEYMFLSIIGIALPQGNNRFLAIVGAVATGMSVIVLLGAKLFWVTPGSQFIWSWAFMGLELGVMTMNDILGYALHLGPVDATLSWWQSVTPASPLIALLGWILMLFFDATQREKQKDMELVAKKQKKEREYLQAAHESEMDLRTDHLNMVTEQLRDAIKSQEAQARIKNHAARMVDRVLTDVSGIVAGDYTPISPTGQQPRQIAPASLANESPASTFVPEATCCDCGKTGNGSGWHFYGNAATNGHYRCPECAAKRDEDTEPTGFWNSVKEVFRNKDNDEDAGGVPAKK